MSNLILTVTAAPVVDTAINASGDTLGGLLTFTGAIFASNGLAKLKAVRITDTSKQSANVDLLLFSANPTGSTFTTNAATAIVAADLPKIVTCINITTHSAFSATGLSYARGLDEKIFSATPVSGVGQMTFTLYGALIARATPTYAATSALNVYLDIEQDV